MELAPVRQVQALVGLAAPEQTGLVEPPGAGVAQGGVGVFLAGGAGVALGAGVLPMRLATLLGE